MNQQQRLAAAPFHWVDDPVDSNASEIRANGYPRFVHAQRARTLRKRGVPLLRLEKPNGHVYYVWWETEASYARRELVNHIRPKDLRKVARRFHWYRAQIGAFLEEYALHPLTKLNEQAAAYMMSVDARHWEPLFCNPT